MNEESALPYEVGGKRERILKVLRTTVCRSLHGPVQIVVVAWIDVDGEVCFSCRSKCRLRLAYPLDARSAVELPVKYSEWNIQFQQSDMIRFAVPPFSQVGGGQVEQHLPYEIVVALIDGLQNCIQARTDKTRHVGSAHDSIRIWIHRRERQPGGDRRILLCRGVILGSGQSAVGSRRN